MSAGRKPGTAEAAEEAAAVDPHAPTRASVPVEAASGQRPAKRVPSGAFTPDAPTKIVLPTPSLEERLPAYDTHAPTEATNLGALDDEDPFAPRPTDAELRSYSSEEAEGEGAAVDDVDDSTRLDLRRPGGRATDVLPLPGFDDDIELDEVVDISLSDMEALPEISADERDEDTHDTVVNVPLPRSLLGDEAPKAPPPAPPRAPVPSLTDPLPIATVVERRSHNPAALFDEDTASVTEGRAAEALPSHASARQPRPVAEEPDSEGAESETSALASERTAARPSLVSQPSGDPVLRLPVSSHDDTPDIGAADVDSALDEAPAYWDEASLPDEERAEPDETVAPESGDVSEEAPLPQLHKWKVVPTAIRELARVTPPPASGAGFGPDERPKTLHTVLWSPDDEAAAREEHAVRRRSDNPFWAPTDVGAELDDDDPLESTEAAAPTDPRHASAAYIHDAIAYLRSLSHFGAHLDGELRKDFEARMLGANEKLRRALTVLHSAFEDASDDER